MDARSTVAGRARGGEGIQAPRPARARLTTALGSLGSLAATGAYTVATVGGGSATPLALVAGVALLVLGAGLVLRWPLTVPWAVLVTGTAYIVSRHGHATVDGAAAAVGAFLLASAELAWWSIDHDARIAQERPVLVRRAVTLAGIVVGSAAVSALLLATAAVAAPAGVLLATLGVMAAVAAVGLVLRLLRAV